MGAGVPQSFQFVHSVAVIQTFAFRLVLALSFHGVSRNTKQKRLEVADRGVGAHPFSRDERYIVVVSELDITLGT